MLNLNQPTNFPTTPVLRLGFRPLFFAASLASVVLMSLWIMFYHFPVSVNNVSDSQWHAHEMVYGYAAAVIVGFLLTATRNWTGLQTLYGKPLLALLLVWIAGRFLAFIEPDYLLYQAIIDTSFLFFASIAIAYPLIKAKKWQHLSIVAKIILLTLTHGIYYLGLLGWLENGLNIGIYAGFYLIISLLLMMSRRLLPFFIEKSLSLKTDLKNSKILDLASLFLLLAFIIIEVFFQSIIAPILSASLFIIHAIRAFNWYHPNIWQKPLLWSIYVAYVLLTLGFGLNALAYFVHLTFNIAIHSFAFGVGLMTLSMMSRVALGHTGRDISHPPKQLTPIFILLILAFIFRVAFITFNAEHYALWIAISQILWVAAFAWFTLIYTPILFKARIDGQFG
jgi:uncharacterized protein involved in response to NO